MRNSMPTMVQPGSNDTERLLTLFLNANEGPVNLASVYAPSLSTTSDAKDEFSRTSNTLSSSGV